MRPLAVKGRSPGRQPGPLTMQLYAAFGGFCSICERPITGDANCVDGRTGATLLDEVEAWGSLLLLCFGCWNAHRLDPIPYDHSMMLLPFDDFHVAIESAPAFVYRQIEVTELLFEGDEVVDERRRVVVVVEGQDSRAMRTVEHFALNESVDLGEGVLRMTASLGSNRDGRLRARSAAWETASRVQRVIGERRDLAFQNDELRALRSALASAGCWSTSLTVLWDETKDPGIVRALFGNTHDGFSVVPGPLRAGEGVSRDRVIVAGADPGNEWAGTRNEWTERLPLAMRYANV